MAKFTRPIFLGTPARPPQAPAPRAGEGAPRPEKAPEPKAPAAPPSQASSWVGSAQQMGSRQLDRLQQGVKDLQRGLRDLARPKGKEGGSGSAPAKGGGGAAPAKGKGGPSSSQSQAGGESLSNPATRGRQGAEGRPGSDSFGQAQAAAKKQTRPALMPPAGPLVASTSESGVLYALNQAQEPGVYYREESRDQGQREDDEDPELAAAVEEAIRLLFGVRGIHHIGPGLNQAGEPVIVIACSRGFASASLALIPDRVHRFKTLVALPYDLLPLRKER